MWSVYDGRAHMYNMPAVFRWIKTKEYYFMRHSIYTERKKKSRVVQPRIAQYMQGEISAAYASHDNQWNEYAEKDWKQSKLIRRHSDSKNEKWKQKQTEQRANVFHTENLLLRWQNFCHFLFIPLFTINNSQRAQINRWDCRFRMFCLIAIVYCDRGDIFRLVMWAGPATF